MTDHRHTYEFDLGPPSLEQLLVLRDLAARVGQPFTPPATRAEARKWLGNSSPSHPPMSLDESIALREALDARDRREASA